jgi:hypothetical protein
VCNSIVIFFFDSVLEDADLCRQFDALPQFDPSSESDGRLSKSPRDIVDNYRKKMQANINRFAAAAFCTLRH